MATNVTELFAFRSRHSTRANPLTRSEFGLRAREARDATALFALFSQPLCRFGLISDPFVSAADLERRLNPNCPDGFEVVFTHADAAIGYGGLFVCPGTRSHVGWLSLFVHDDFHGRGIGGLLLQTLLATADFARGLDRVELAVRAGNDPAIALYRKFGFEIEGNHPAFARRDGVDLDVLTMARLRRQRRPSGTDAPLSA